MKIQKTLTGILIIPETDFESEYIASFGREDLTCFVKRGVAESEIVGIQIKHPKE